MFGLTRKLSFFLTCTLFILLFTSGLSSWAEEIAPEELARATRFVQERFSNPKTFPFSFVYNGRSSSDLLNDWSIVRNISETSSRRQTTLTLREPDGPLLLRCEITEYIGFPQVEWILYFKNDSKKSTEIIESIHAIDLTVAKEPFELLPVSGWDPQMYQKRIKNRDSDFLLHHFQGSNASMTDFQPMETPLSLSSNRASLNTIHLTSRGGKPSYGYLPYFNLQSEKTRGVILALGWPGQWSIEFIRESASGVRIRGGQEQTHFRLLAGEEVRSPRIVLQPWDGESWFHGQNIWRSWMIAHNIPRTPEGTIVRSHIAACSSHWYSEMTKADTESQKLFIDRYLEEKIPLDYWWMDAGWYPCEGWVKTGNWLVDTNRFPKGLREITDYGRSKGVRSIVWFEPERFQKDTLLGAMNRAQLTIPGSSNLFLNLGDPWALKWVVQHIGDLIEKEGIDMYRQDLNADPLDYWRRFDAPDRQGITEIKYIEGYLAYWDSLLARKKGLRIDTCAGGGRRLDIDTLRRGVPLLRSDYLLEPVSQQIHTGGLSLWLPFQGTALRAFDPYAFRSNVCSYLNLCYDARDRNADWDALRKNIKEWQEYLCPFYGADYYPLTRIVPDVDVWAGWQWNDPQKGAGVLQFFRREESLFETGVFKLFGLDKQAQYQLRDLDSNEVRTISGKELMEEGISVCMKKMPQSVLISYRKVK